MAGVLENVAKILKRFTALGFAVLLMPGLAVAHAQEVPVNVAGYTGDLMEPFLSRDGEVLFFNNRNDPAELTDLHLATRKGLFAFEYAGPLEKINSDQLDAVASVSDKGRLVFVTTREYFRSHSTLFEAELNGVKTGEPSRIDGLARGLGWLHFDAEISADGEKLYVAEGRFAGGALPEEANLVIAVKSSVGFSIDRRSRIFQAVNSAALEFAPALTTDERMLVFTRFVPGSAHPEMFASYRENKEQAFGSPQKLPISGFVEAATFTPDEQHIIYHRRQADRYKLYAHPIGRNE